MPPFRLTDPLWGGVAVAALAFLLYANTLAHGWVLDDAIVITDNMFTQRGIEGLGGIFSKDTFFGFFKVEGKEALVSGGRYRPLTVAMFAVVYEMFGDKPAAFHFLTVLLYGLLCFVLYRTLRLLLSERFPGEGGAWLALIAAGLFAAHPVHTEVVANVKGCDEIATLLFSMLTLAYTLKAWDTGQWRYVWYAAGVFFLANLSKENAVTFLAAIPLALALFRRRETALKGGYLGVLVPLLGAFLLFLAIRGSILGWQFGGTPMELMNNPFLKYVGPYTWAPFTFAEKLAAVILAAGKYLALLFWPHPLTHDYYPRQLPYVQPGDWRALGIALLYAALAGFAVLRMRARPLMCFGILYFFFTFSIVSNLIFPIGTNMGERFLFMPSVGFALCVAALLHHLFIEKNKTVVALGIAGLMVALYAVKTVSRNPVWESNERLFFTDIKTSVNSAKLQNACGSYLFEQARDTQDTLVVRETALRSVAHLSKAIEIHPTYKDAYLSRGGSHFLLKEYEQAISDYREALRIQPNEAKAKTGLSYCLREAGRYYGQVKGDLAKAMKYFEEAWSYNKEDGETAHSIGVVLGLQQKPQEALPWFEKAVALTPDNSIYRSNLASSLMAVGRQEAAQQEMQRAMELKAAGK